VSSFAFLDPEVTYKLSQDFDFQGYIDVERELWAFFPETAGKRVNYCQLGLSARLYAEIPDERNPLQADETYFLMPCEDRTLRPVRMKSERILTLDEFRMSHLTSMRMSHKLFGLGRLMDEVNREVLGPEIVAEISQQF
jgi:hypothetical protein